MKLVELKCKNCGAILKINPDTPEIHCEHCKANFRLDDEARHIKYDDMDKVGYEYEKGRLKARHEYELEKQHREIEAKERASKAKRDADNKKWVILAWIFLFPFMLTYWIWKKSSLDKRAKIALIGGMWILFFIIGAAAPDSTQNTPDADKSIAAHKSEDNTKVIEEKDNDEQKQNSEKDSQLSLADAWNACGVMEAVDLYNSLSSITSPMERTKRANTIFQDGMDICEDYYVYDGEDSFISSTTQKWNNRKNEEMDGHPLTWYFDTVRPIQFLDTNIYKK